MTLKYVVAGLLLVGAVAQAEVQLLVDDFSSGSVSSQSRYSDEDLGSWLTRYGNWTITGGALTDDLAHANSETALVKLFELTETDTNLTEITISFDYAVPADTTLYFYASGYEGPLADTLNARMTAADGQYALGTDFNAHLGTGYNLLDGATPTGDTGAALDSFSNTSGTFSQTYDISAFAGVDDLTDFAYMLVAFGVDETAAGGSITIDNFRVTAAASSQGTLSLIIFNSAQ